MVKPKDSINPEDPFGAPITDVKPKSQGLFGDPMLFPSGSGAELVAKLKDAAGKIGAGIMGADSEDAPEAPKAVAPPETNVGDAQAKLRSEQEAAKPIALSDLASALGQQKLPPMPGVNGSASREMADAYKTAAKTQTDLGDAESNRAIAQAQGMSDSAEAAKTELAAFQQRMAVQNEKINQAAQDVANGKVDPNHFMSSMGTGQKVANAIGMILGGIGAGMTGGQNPVLGIIDKQIQRDIDAQKDNLDNKRGMLRHYMEQGHDMESSSRMVMGANQQIRASELEAAAMKMNSPVLQKSALLQAQELRAKGVTAVQEAQQRSAALAQQAYNNQLQRAQMGQTQAAQMVHGAMLQGKKVQGDVLRFVPEEGRKMMVQPSPGVYQYANGEKAKATYEEGKLAADNVQRALDKFAGLREKHSGGKALSDSDKTEAEIAAQDLQKNLEHLYGYTRPASGDEGAALKSVIENPLKFLTTDAKIKAAARAIQDTKDNRMMSLNGLLMGGK